MAEPNDQAKKIEAQKATTTEIATQFPCEILVATTIATILRRVRKGANVDVQQAGQTTNLDFTPLAFGKSEKLISSLNQPEWMQKTSLHWEVFSFSQTVSHVHTWCCCCLFAERSNSLNVAENDEKTNCLQNVPTAFVVPLIWSNSSRHIACKALRMVVALLTFERHLQKVIGHKSSRGEWWTEFFLFWMRQPTTNPLDRGLVQPVVPVYLWGPSVNVFLLK